MTVTNNTSITPEVYEFDEINPQRERLRPKDVPLSVANSPSNRQGNTRNAPNPYFIEHVVDEDNSDEDEFQVTSSEEEVPQVEYYQNESDDYTPEVRNHFESFHIHSIKDPFFRRKC